MDFAGAEGFMGRVQTFRDRTLRTLPFMMLLLLAGCVTTQTTKEAEPVKAATLQVQPPNPEPSPANKEIACRIQMIDGVMIARSDGLRPGHHRLVVALGANEGEHTGDVDLIIPAAKHYRLRAEREEDTFTVSLVEAESGKLVATSSAAAGQVMTFQVFVIQK